MNTGVYGIYYKDKLIYVGSAAVSFDHRWKMHLRELQKNYHHCSRLQNTFNKYGNVFAFEILETCKPDKCITVEQVYLDSYYHTGLWNGTPTAGSCKGRKYTEKQKLNRSIQMKRIMSSASHREQIQASNKKTWSNPELKRQHSIIIRKTQACSEVRQKMSVMCLKREKKKQTFDKLEYVHKRRDSGLFQAQVKRGGARIFVKTFKTALEAYLAAYSAIAIYNSEYCEVRING